MANPAVILRQVQPGEAVLVNTDTAASIVLNATGISAWQRMDGQHTLEDLVIALKQQFEGVPDSAVEDVRALVKALAEEGFVGYELRLSEREGRIVPGGQNGR
jgi:hypothetical protein